MRGLLPWRFVVAVERLLPASVRAAVVARGSSNTPAATRRRSRWMAFAVKLPFLMLAVTQIAIHHADMVDMWPVWRSMLLDLALVIAGAVVVASIASGIHAWRVARRVA